MKDIYKSLKRFFNNKIVSTLLISLIIFGVILNIFPVNVSFLKSVPNFTIMMIFIYLFFGLFFLIISNSRLLLISFIAAGVLSLFLKSFSNESMGLINQSVENSLIISNYNLKDHQGNIVSFIKQIDQEKGDVICLHEVKPEWARVIKIALEHKFPNQVDNISMEGYGKMVLSSLSFNSIDTIYYYGIPAFDITLKLNERVNRLIVTQTIPPFKRFKGLSSKDHLDFLSNYINQLNQPVILAGEFNQVYWSREIRDMLESTGLSNSRRFISSFGDGVPYEHIFHSDDYECSRVRELSDDSNNHIGIEAVLNLKSSKGS